MAVNEWRRGPASAAGSARSILVLITDFCEGGTPGELERQIEDLADAGVRCIGLGALGSDARPAYDKVAAARCRKAGMDILVCTPERLAEAMAEIIRDERDRIRPHRGTRRSRRCGRLSVPAGSDQARWTAAP